MDGFIGRAEKGSKWSTTGRVRRVALAGHYKVKASIEVQATAANGKRQTYLVNVILTWR